MKIGIVTYHRNHNYGAILQAIATRLLFQSLGHKVYYINYSPQYIIDLYSVFSFKEMISRGPKGAVSYLRVLIENYKSKIKRIRSFEKFIDIYNSILYGY